ncbi:MAG: hypothetical protein J6K90_06425 [Tidjanibacter sp.]|nr:hypothetical protein [Tidjanibacter sp.]
MKEMVFLSALLIAVCVIWSVVMTVWIICGVVCTVRNERRREAVMAVEQTTGNPMAEAGISVVVCGCRGFVDVAEHLSADYLFYEVILVCDTYRTVEGRELLEHYGMVRVEAEIESGRLCGDVRAVYRSKERRYRRLVVVDHHGEDEEEMLNCGLAVASYDYVIPVMKGVLLRPDALIMFNSALHEAVGCGVDKRNVVVAGCSERVSSQNSFEAIRDAVSNVRVAVRLGRRFYGYRYVAMWCSDRVRAAGGFVVRGGAAVCDMRKAEGGVKMIGAVAEDVGRLMIRDVEWQRGAVRFFWCIWGLVVLWEIIDNGGAVSERLRLVPLLAYVAVGASGAIALSVEASRGYVVDQLRYRALLTVLLYPLREFVWLWRSQRH